jgi:hypothetical protein
MQCIFVHALSLPLMLSCLDFDRGFVADADGAPAAMSKDAAFEHLTALFGGEVATQLKDTNWKNRLAGMEHIVSLLEANCADQQTVKTMHAFCHVPGWKDTNVQVHACLLVCNVSHDDLHRIVTIASELSTAQSLGGDAAGCCYR